MAAFPALLLLLVQVSVGFSSKREEEAVKLKCSWTDTIDHQAQVYNLVVDEDGKPLFQDSLDDCKAVCEAMGDACKAVMFDKKNRGGCYWTPPKDDRGVYHNPTFDFSRKGECQEEFTYEKIPRHWMAIRDGASENVVDIYTIREGETVEQCKEACSANAECKMFNHLRKAGKCFLMSVTKDEKPKLWKRKRKYDAYVKQTVDA